MKATIQIYNDGSWYDAAELLFTSSQMSSKVTLSYFVEYISKAPQYGLRDRWACSVNAPITIIPTEYDHWSALLDDLLPAGKSRDWWLNYLDVSRSTEFDQNFALLTHACMAPIGHIRIKEAVQSEDNHSEKRFDIEDVATLQHDFLEYANENGSAVGGATGAGGVAPKLLLMLEDNQRRTREQSGTF